MHQRTKLVVAILVALSAAPASAQKMVVCTKADGTKYAGFDPPEGCVASKPSGTPTPSDAAVSAENVEHARAYCAEEWPESPGMQQSCTEKQTEALTWLADMAKANDDNEKYATIVTRCRTEAQKGETWDWEIVRHCIEKEISTYERIDSPRKR